MAWARIRFILASLLTGLWLLAAATPVSAFDETAIIKGEADARQLQTELRGLTALPRNFGSSEIVQSERARLSEIRSKAKSLSDGLSGPLNELSTQVGQLGPPPEPGKVEAPAIAIKRSNLNGQLDRLRTLGKQFDLLALEAEQAEARLTELQREQFLQRIFTTERSILDPRLWWDTMAGSTGFAEAVSQRTRAALNIASSKFQPALLLIFPLGMVLLWLVANRILPLVFSRISAPGETAETASQPTALSRLWRAVWASLRLLLAVLLGFILLGMTLAASGYLEGFLEELFTVVGSAVASGIVSGGFLYFVCAPRHPAWRLIAVRDRAAVLLSVFGGLAVFVDAVGIGLSELSSSLSMPVSFVVGQSALTALLLIVLLASTLAIVRREATQNLAGSDTPFFLIWFLRFMPLLWLLVIIAALALIFGFVALAYFVASNLLNTALLVVLLGLLHALAEAFTAALQDARSAPGHLLRRFTSWTDTGISRIALLLRTLADVVLVLIGAIVLLGTWSDVLFDTTTIFTALRDGFSIGNIEVSPGALLIGLSVLVLGVLLTKYITSWLDRRVLAETRFDPGVRNSIQSAAGYAGYAAAGLLALTATGADFSQFALVLGALGVGIGFGLQSIVNNFVSGLILLAERPVRVGDWVALNAGEGIVKKINVRSTEIETFDNCTIIVPNSNLITEAVRNWTHRDTVGRFTVSVSVAHGSDAKAIAKTLLNLAQDHPKVMRHPAPTVHLSRLSPTSLDYDLRGYTQHVFDAVNISSDLRMAITEKLPKKILLLAPPAPPPGRK